MTEGSLHSEWLALVDVSGPFLAEPVLNQAFPQGLEQIEATKRKVVRQAYEEWRDAIDSADPELPALHSAWLDLVLKSILELDDDGKGDVLKPQDKLSKELVLDVPEHGISLRPNYAVVADQKGDRALLLVNVYEPEVPLDKPVAGDGWAATPAERMVDLCRSCGVRLGLVTNGERWMLIDAPVGATATFASWYARLWGQEPLTLQAFVNLLGVRRFFVDPNEQLPALFDESLKLQDEVTDALGEQVRRAVEVLIQRLDRADVDLNRKLLEGVGAPELYEAALTIMMRIVFLLSAEERGLLLMGDERYEANYAVSTLRMQLRAESEEILERRQDAWSRLLSIFRAVYGGIQHDAMRLPALGGSLFDPDRFPFLEGRASGSKWKVDLAKPLPIDNRTVLLLLDAVQLFQGRTLSYAGLDVEQIGYVYEGLLERTVERANEVTLDLNATKSAKRPWVTLRELETAAGQGEGALEKLLNDRTGVSSNRIKNDLTKKVDDADAEILLTACQGDQTLRSRIKPYFHFLRIDPWGYPLVYPEKTFMVTTGADRRETGTHYTPKSLTEVIVKETLEPIAYVGPEDGRSREGWVLKSPAELLELKICDPAMGSGAFLVQTCRWLAERLVEAWEKAEGNGKAVTAEGIVVEKQNGYEPLRSDSEERLLTAKRLIAERCLYGVDVNPLAVELAKLSIWLLTLAKGRPFAFLDHNLRSGDSLIGIHKIEQLIGLDLNPNEKRQLKLFGRSIHAATEKSLALRMELRAIPIKDISDVEAMSALNTSAMELLDLPRSIADRLIEISIGFCKKPRFLRVELNNLAADADRAYADLTSGVDRSSVVSRDRRYLHWPLEFPEVFLRHRRGFDAIVGNPPYVNAVLRSENVDGGQVKKFFSDRFLTASGSYDLYVLFIERAFMLCSSGGYVGVIVPNKVLSAEYAEALRRFIIQKCEIRSIIDYSSVAVFSASVYPIVFVMRCEKRSGEARIHSIGTSRLKLVPQSAFEDAPSYLWSFILTDFSRILEKTFVGTVPLGTIATVSGAATVSEAYEIVSAIEELALPKVPEGFAKFVVSGNIRAFHTTWENSAVQYLKNRLLKPIETLNATTEKLRQQAL